MLPRRTALPRGTCNILTYRPAFVKGYFFIFFTFSAFPVFLAFPAVNFTVLVLVAAEGRLCYNQRDMEPEEEKSMKRCAALICLLCCLLGGALAEKQEWTGAEWARLKEALASDKVNPVPEGRRMAAPKLSAGEKDFANVLLLSTDAPEGEKNFGRADAILVCRVDLTTGDMHLVSLPEDALAEVDGLPQAVALRYVNCFGGPALVASVVNKALGLSVNRYCAVSEEAFERAVDTLGGVSMELTAGEGQALGLSEGRHTLQGRQALRYVRLRRTGDGSLRIRALLEAALQQAVARNSLSGALQLIDAVLPCLSTNLTTEDLVNLAFALFGQETPGSFAALGLKADGEGRLMGGAEQCRAFLYEKGE